MTPSDTVSMRATRDARTACPLGAPNPFATIPSVCVWQRVLAHIPIVHALDFDVFGELEHRQTDRDGPDADNGFAGGPPPFAAVLPARLIASVEAWSAVVRVPRRQRDRIPSPLHSDKEHVRGRGAPRLPLRATMSGRSFLRARIGGTSSVDRPLVVRSDIYEQTMLRRRAGRCWWPQDSALARGLRWDAMWP